MNNQYIKLRNVGLLSIGRWDPLIREKLEQLIIAHGSASAGYNPSQRPVAIFDWDNTSIKGDIGEAVMEERDHRDRRNRVKEYESICQAQGKAAGYTWGACQIAGMTSQQIRELTQDVIKACLANNRIQLRAEIRELMEVLKTKGWDVWVVSATAQPIVETFTEYYGILANHVIGVRLAQNSKGVFLPHLEGPLTYRAGKVEAIEKYIGAVPTFAAGDADTDVEMLQSAQYALLIDRGNSIALEAARAGGWWIQTGW